MPSPAPAAAPAPAPAVTPRDARPTSGSHLAAMLEVGLSELRQLETTPLAQPAILPEQPPVPIETLLYRGKAALQRAIEVRESIRQHPGTPPAEALDELYELLDLALVD